VARDRLAGGDGRGAGADILTPSEAAFEDLRARLDEIGPTGYVLVDEVVDGERQRRGRIQLAEFVNTWGDQVGDQWGAGSYVCDARDAKSFIKRGIELKFSASYGVGKKGKGAAASPATPAAGAGGAAAGDPLTLLLGEIRAQAAREHEVLMEVLKGKGAAAPAGLTAADVAREVDRVIAQRMPAGPRAVSQQELFEMAGRLVRDVRGAGSDEDALTIAIREGAGLLGKIFDADKGGAGKTGNGAGGKAHGADNGGGGDEMDFRSMAYRSILGRLLEARKAGYSPARTAGEFWKSLPPELVGGVYEVLQQEDWLETLAGFVPAVRDHAGWFGELRDELLKAYTEGAAT